MEKTAIEWFVNKLDNWGIKSLRDRETIIKQAKEMEKEQHKKTWSEGMFCETGNIQAFEQYYNGTFKSE